MVYYLTNALPLMSLLGMLINQRSNSIYLPQCMEGVRLSFFDNLPDTDETTHETIVSNVPTYFWRSQFIWKLPSKQKFRRKLCREVFDSAHYEHCSTKQFQLDALAICRCIVCNDMLHPYHIEYEFCNNVWPVSPVYINTVILLLRLQTGL